jgi:broad specificity phosphatase PhoE
MNTPNITPRKNVYFLRHGQTVLNRKNKHQFPETLLSEKGRAQAHAIALKLKEIPIDVIVCSSYERTRETAQIILDTIGSTVLIEYNDLFVELRNPRTLWGTSWFTPKSLWIMGMIYLMAGKENWHYSDEENLEEFHTRSRRALEYLSDRSEKNILVVSHRGFIVNLMSSMKSDGMNTVQQFRKTLIKNISIKNCCFISTVWSPNGEYGETLDGTWEVKKGTTCPGKGV